MKLMFHLGLGMAFLCLLLLMIPSFAQGGGSTRIVNGERSKPYPYFALLEMEIEDLFGNKRFGYCGGTLIHKDIVLSAAHCFPSASEGEFLASLLVVLNATDAYNPSGYEVLRTVDGWLLHPGYNDRTLKNDVLLFRLDESVRTIAPVKLNRDPLLPVNGETVHVFGFGQTSAEGPLSTYLQVIDKDIVSNNVCSSTNPNFDPDFKLCAASAGKNACNGDSGGPLVDDRISSSDVQYGIVSYGTVSGSIGPCHPGANAVYARVSAYVEWIDAIICNDSRDPPANCGGPNPTRSPTPFPTRNPTLNPALPTPTRSPTPFPTRNPTPNPALPTPTRSPTPVPTRNPTPSPVSSSCQDVPGWYDSDGDDCEWYAVGDRCQTFGDGFSNFGYTANEACCVCGRSNVPTPTRSPTPFPTRNPTPNPVLPTPTRSPTPVPTRNPTPSPVSSSCRDVPGWYDSDGDDCEWYAVGNRCQIFGDGFSNFGYTANEACCVCRGG